jgi:hypothetical protein
MANVLHKKTFFWKHIRSIPSQFSALATSKQASAPPAILSARFILQRAAEKTDDAGELCGDAPFERLCEIHEHSEQIGAAGMRLKRN